MHNFSRQDSKKLCDTSQQNCCLLVLLHPLERRCVSYLASGNFALHNKRFSVEEATILLDLAAKSGDISRTVSATNKFIPTVSARSIVELENTQGGGIPKLMIFMILLYTAIFEKRWYLVAAFAVSLACAVLRYRLLKVSSVNYLPSRTVAGPTFRRVACELHAR